MGRGVFIAFEGGEGAGKSTQASSLAQALRARGHEVVVTREPGGSEAAEAIREVLLDRRFTGMSDRAEALLFAAARAEHVAQTIRPALDRGAVVVTDRYIDSSIAYQGIARALGVDVVEEISLWATENLVPDLTIVLDIAPTVGLTRTGEPDRMEAEPIDFHLRVREGFLDRARQAPGRYVVIDAQGDRAAVAAAVLSAVEPVIERVS